MDNRIEDLLESLKQERDELRLKLHLGSMEAKEEWEKLEKRFQELLAESEAKSKPLREVVDESAKDVGSALKLVAEELERSYRRLREQLKS